MMKYFKKLAGGAALVEYVTLMAFISVLVTGAVLNLGHEVRRLLDIDIVDEVAQEEDKFPFETTASPPPPEEIAPGTMVTVYRGTEAEVGFYGSYVNAVIDWGDGTTSTKTSLGRVSHTYAKPGDYVVTVSGSTDNFRGSPTLLGVADFGDLGLTSLDSAFQSNPILSYVAPLPEGVTSLYQMMRFSDANPEGMEVWDTSNVTDMRKAFQSTDNFNRDIGSWDVSSVTAMGNMFNYAASFNQDLTGWDTGNLTSMAQIFKYAGAFDGDVSGWDTSNVTTFDQMFDHASSFTGKGVETWDVSSATNLNAMFFAAKWFNGDVTGWDTSNVTIMAGTFHTAEAFNQPIGSWNTSKVTDMGAMFNNADNFSADLSGWDTSKVTNMKYMFSSTFDSGSVMNIGGWDVSSVTNMEYMFKNNTQFFEDLHSWCPAAGVLHGGFALQAQMDADAGYHPYWACQE